MAKKKENLLRQLAKDTFTSLPEQEIESKIKERKGIREGTRGISGARVISIDRIKCDPDQPRKTLDKKYLSELANSIKTHGILQPIAVEYIEEEDYFKIINGERRCIASQKAGLKEIPCIIKNIDRLSIVSENVPLKVVNQSVKMSLLRVKTKTKNPVNFL